MGERTAYFCEKIECKTCNKMYMRSNTMQHKSTKFHKAHEQELVSDLTKNEKKKILAIIEKINHEDLKKLLI